MTLINNIYIALTLVVFMLTFRYTDLFLYSRLALGKLELDILEQQISSDLDGIESETTSPYQLLSLSFNTLSYALLSANKSVVFDVNKDLVSCADYIVIQPENKDLTFMQQSLLADDLYSMMGSYLNFDNFIKSQYKLNFYILG